MNKMNDFLCLYKEYETLLKNDNIEPLDYENSLENKNRLMMCRQFRNFYSHNDDASFIEPTDRMMNYLEQLVLSLKEKGDCMEKHIKKAVFKETDKCNDVIERLVKLKCNYAVTENENVYSIFTLLQAKKTAKLQDCKQEKIRKMVVQASDIYNKEPMLLLCSKNNKIIGIVC